MGRSQTGTPVWESEKQKMLAEKQQLIIDMREVEAENQELKAQLDDARRNSSTSAKDEPDEAEFDIMSAIDVAVQTSEAEKAEKVVQADRNREEQSQPAASVDKSR